MVPKLSITCTRIGHYIGTGKISALIFFFRGTKVKMKRAEQFSGANHGRVMERRERAPRGRRGVHSVNKNGLNMTHGQLINIVLEKDGNEGRGWRWWASIRGAPSVVWKGGGRAKMITGPWCRASRGELCTHVRGPRLATGWLLTYAFT